VARTDAINNANVINEVTVVFPGANGGKTPGAVAVKDSTLAQTMKTVLNTGVVGHLDIVIDAALAASGWEARDRVLARTAAAMLADARTAEPRRRPFAASGAGAVHPYGGGADNY
jgi:hypothetical protein